METAEARLKRMRMRSWRRGTKEMDLVLGPFADAHLESLSEADLLTYDVLLAENDQDLMAWILGQSAAPATIASLLSRIASFAETRLSRET
ncbi:succinate dehydrogenase assembly factor 2 [Tabrizicola aquatica]|jgi:antitoxin CptB|uniref:FAD assembly factor SdhE n=1 Tax=Tabrizicola aquatica TaxID=909926 RepID=UPI000CD0AD20|nr:succinate dehydrogenase assembly factor 2 [Tabrizicola aquatica]